VRPGTSPTTVTATSTTWSAGLFAGVIDAEASNLSGAYNFAFNVATSGSVTASSVSNPRIDTLAVQISDPPEDGSANPLVTLIYTTGVASATPVAPVAPARSFVIAQLQFPAGTGTTPTVTWVSPYMVAPGGVGWVATFSQIPGSGNIGDKFVTLDSGIVYRLAAGGWKPWESDWILKTPSVANVTLGTGGTVTGKYRWEQGLMHERGVLVLGSSGFAMGTDPTLTLQATAAALDHVYQKYPGFVGLWQSSTPREGVVYAANTSVTTVIFYGLGTVASGTAYNINSTLPFTWAAGNQLRWDFSYIPA
jgi:hypothetical protein